MSPVEFAAPVPPSLCALRLHSVGGNDAPLPVTPEPAAVDAAFKDHVLGK